MIEQLLQTVAGAAGPWLYVIAFSLVFVETAFFLGFLVPGETTLLVAGAASHFGTLHLGVTVTVAVVAAIVGDLVGFAVGRRWGPALRRSRLGRWVGERRWAAVDASLVRRGGDAVFLARLTAVLRAVMPFAAGSSGMSYRRFVPWNVAGGVVWGAGAVLLGWSFAQALSTVGRYLTWAPIALLALVVVVVVARHRRRQRRPARSDAPPAPVET